MLIEFFHFSHILHHSFALCGFAYKDGGEEGGWDKYACRAVNSSKNSLTTKKCVSWASQYFHQSVKDEHKKVLQRNGMKYSWQKESDWAHLLEWPIACWHVFTYFTPDSNVQLSDAWKVKFISRKQNPFRFHWSLWTHLQKAKTSSKDFDRVLLSAFFVAIIAILNVCKWLEMFPCEKCIETSICFFRH